MSYLLFVDDVDAGLDVREGVGSSEDGLSLVLFVQVTVRPSIQRKRRAIDKPPQVVVLIEVCDPVLHLIGVEIRFNIRDLNESLCGGKSFSQFILFLKASTQSKMGNSMQMS